MTTISAIALTAGRIAEVSGGRIAAGAADARIANVSTDTRSLKPGDLYVAIRGESFDGNAFVADALKKGACGAVCEQAPAAADVPPGAFVVQVADSVRALGAMAREWRRIVNPMVVAITGSSGKTTTKELAAHLCEENLSLLVTAGNLNNHIGLPITLLGLKEEHTTAIVEVGMNHSGELRTLTEIAEPSIGVLTNIGDAHLGNFRSIDDLVAAKGELFATMKRNTTAIVNADCPNMPAIRKMNILPWEVITFGEGPDANIRATDIKPIEPYGWEFTLWFYKWDQPVRLPVFGRYQVANALAASTVALLLGVTPETIQKRMATFDPPKQRSHVHTWGGVRVIEDCYNASPSATVAALKSFAETGGMKRRFALLGDLAELGRFGEAQHRRVGAAAAQAMVDRVVAVGDLSRWTAEEAEAEGARAEHFGDVEAAVQYLLRELQPGDGVLVKGSRAARLERAIELLKSELAAKEKSK